MSLKIRIISDPGGDPPSEVRQAWIGLTLETDPQMPQPSETELTTVTKIEKQPAQKVYLVTVKEAILDKLKAKDQSAYEWWWLNTLFPLHPEKHLAFPVNACEVIK